LGRFPGREGFIPEGERPRTDAQRPLSDGETSRSVVGHV